MARAAHLLLIVLSLKAADASSKCTSEQGACSIVDEVDDAQAISTSLLQTDVHVNRVMPELKEAAAPVTTTSWHKPANRAEAAGVKLNGEGDFIAFVSALVTNIMMVIVCVGIFMVLKGWYPDTFARGLKTNSAPLNEIPEGTFGWIKAAWNADTLSIMQNKGLDQAMLIEFQNLGMRLMAMIGVPMFFIMGPIHCMFGGHRAGGDHLSYFSFGNVVDGSPLYWIHAFIIWAVVFTVQTSIYKAQGAFLKYRFQWLEELPEVRGHTILVEGIPDDFQSDSKLKGFFEKMFGNNAVKSSYVVKNSPELEAACIKRDALKKSIANAEFQASKSGSEADATQATEFKTELAALDSQIKSLQQTANQNSGTVGPDGGNTSNGFVTFVKRSDAEWALSVQYSEDFDEWQVSVPPEPNCILWSDLQQSSAGRTGFTILGYLLTAGLYMLYMPAVIYITQIATKINMGPLQPLWQGFAPTMGLQFMVAFLPTFLILIFRCCFTLKDDNWAQQTLQNWYFVFSVVFVILITAIGGSVGQFMETLAESPFKVFKLLGTTMPFATHFYMNYLALQWAAHAMVLMRYIPLAKYVMFRRFMDDDAALEMSEPEDQDYYGIGSRMCRQATMLCIGVIYGTLSPPINLLCFMEFFVCRIIYGYLIPFAETKKGDLGGAFWVQSLRHLFVGNIIYCIVMTGVLAGRAATNGPVIIAAPSLFYVVWSMKKFERSFLWERLPMKELLFGSGKSKAKEDEGQYIQPMFL